jgi:hypothetical protein
MITKDMHITDILRLYPQTAKVFENFKLDAFAKSRLSGENRSPEVSKPPVITGFRLSPE